MRGAGDLVNDAVGEPGGDVGERYRHGSQRGCENAGDGASVEPGDGEVRTDAYSGLGGGGIAGRSQQVAAGDDCRGPA